MCKTAVLLIALLCLALPGRAKTASTQEEMVALALPHLPIAEEEAASLRTVGQARQGGMALLILAVGEGEEAAYFPVSFDQNGSRLVFSALEEGKLTRRARAVTATGGEMGWCCWWTTPPVSASSEAGGQWGQVASPTALTPPPCSFSTRRPSPPPTGAGASPPTAAASSTHRGGSCSDLAPDI